VPKEPGGEKTGGSLRSAVTGESWRIHIHRVKTGEDETWRRWLDLGASLPRSGRTFNEENIPGNHVRRGGRTVKKGR